MALPSMAAAGPVPEMPADGDPLDERYWEMIKQQFAVPSNRVMMNAANLCPPPYSVAQQVEQTLTELGQDVSFQFRDKFDAIRITSLEKLSAYLGVSKDEVAITRNTSEGNNIIVNGFDLKAGDEVVLWDENHESNLISWEYRAKRLGFVVKKVTLPANPASNEEIIQLFQKAMTSRTRVLAFSHISNHNAIVLPARELCALARSKNILTHVDGAQSFGFMNLNLKELGCDSYTGSLHKWFMGPFETGVLYVRKELVDRLWPQIISAGWAESARSVDARYGILGQRNEAMPAAIPGAVDFHLKIGKPVVEARVRELNRYLRAQLAAKVPNVQFISPEALTANITFFNVPGKASEQIYRELYTTYGIASAPMAGVRLSPNIYITLGDIDRVVDAVNRIARGA